MVYQPLVRMALCLTIAGTPISSQPTPDAAQQGRESGARSPAAVPASAANPSLQPTVHPPVPIELTELWLAPAAGDVKRARTPVFSSFVSGVEAYRRGNHSQALPLVGATALRKTPLADYSTYYTGLVQFRMTRLNEARRTFAGLRAGAPQGYLAEAALLREAEVAEALGDHAAAARLYEELSKQTSRSPDDVFFRLARTSLAAGDRNRAAVAFLRVRYEYPLSDLSTAAGTHLEKLREVQRPEAFRRLYELDLGRAERLFGARRYAEARGAFEALRSASSGQGRELVDLRLAACDFHLKRYAAVLERTRPYLNRGSKQDEAQFYYLSALRASGNHAEYVTRARRLVHQFPESPWAEETLNNLATHYILASDPARAAEVFGEQYAKFPTGARAERAAWRRGWWDYKEANYAETIRIFERAAVDFPRSDYRPAWLYWAARSHEKLRAREAAHDRYLLVAEDYLNSYYGRLAAGRLQSADRSSLQLAGIIRTGAAAGGHGGGEDEGHVAGESSLPPTRQLVRLLLALGLFDEAMDELLYAERAWGASPAIQATMAWIHHQRGDLRRAITVMRRAYPQHFAAGGERLPEEILRIIFPLAYSDLIHKHATARNLDPYLVASLVLQESTFHPTIRSPANAYGLMQIIPPTGRRLARSLGLQFRQSMLTTPETNVRLGTTYFANLVRQFGGAHLALAGYNAGEHRVVRWLAERRGFEQDEFIDDIPFPETQNYVKKVLGAADDYRRLYPNFRTGGPGPFRAAAAAQSSAPPAAGALAPQPGPTAPARRAPGREPAPAKK
jgi:soluble lytic murein transglycosylase